MEESMKQKYKVVSGRQVLHPPYDSEHTPARQLEEFLNGESDQGWSYKATLSHATVDTGLSIDFVILEKDTESY